MLLRETGMAVSQCSTCSCTLPARPVIGIWHPTWSTYMMVQDYKTPTASGKELTLNRPFFGTRDLTVHNPARRTFVLDLTWKFNEAQSKYRGSGAGSKQKARM